MTSDKTKIALLEQAMLNNDKDHAEIKSDLAGVKSDIKGMTDKLDAALACKADKDELNYWRNVLVSGILITIFVTIVINLLVN